MRFAIRLFAGAIAWVVIPLFVAHADHRVLVIGIDGAGGSFLRNADTPFIDALAAQGAVRYDFLNEAALVPNPPSGYGASGVNWSTITTGASAAHHGVVDNSFAGSRFDQYPHFFQYVKENDPTKVTASIVNWAPINDQILANGIGSVEQQFSQDASVRNAVTSLLNNSNPQAIFVHFDEVDAAGHAYGWGSPAYYTAISNVDTLIGGPGGILPALNARPGVVAGSEDWLVIVTADHGGQGTGHNAGQGLIDWEVPFVVSGPSVADGAEIAPGTLRDVVPTALWHLGIDPFALGLDGTVRGLPVNPPNGIAGDINQDGVVSGNGKGPVVSDDVTAFVAGWLTAGGGGVAERYARGDLNFDGITDLADWALLNSESPSLGAAAIARLSGLPEPGTALLLLVAMPHALWIARRRRSVASRLPKCAFPPRQNTPTAFMLR